MSYSRLLIHTVTVTNPAEGDTNRYGDPSLLYDEANTGTTYPARMEPVAANENLDNRDTRITRYQAFLPAGADITALSIVTWEGEQYRVDGEPAHIDGRRGPHHIEATLERIDG